MATPVTPCGKINCLDYSLLFVYIYFAFGAAFNHFRLLNKGLSQPVL